MRFGFQSLVIAGGLGMQPGGSDQSGVKAPTSSAKQRTLCGGTTKGLAI